MVTDDAALAEQVRRLRGHGMTQQYVHEAVSQNFRMSELEAAWLRLGLPSLGGRRRGSPSHRGSLSRGRSAAPLADASTPRTRTTSACSAPPHRDEVRARLADAGVSTAVHYPVALTEQPAYRADVRRERLPERRGLGCRVRDACRASRR